MMQRILDAARFYAGELRRQAQTELVAWRAVVARKPAVAYMGWVGFGNLGDEILYEAHVALFSEFILVPFRPSFVAYAYEKLRGKSLYIAGFLGGGTLINQSANWLMQMQYFQKRGLPLSCVGTGVTEDKFRAWHERTNLREWIAALGSFQSVGVRGPRSQKILEEAGLTKFQVVGDTALALAPPKMRHRPENRVIGFNYGLVKENQIWGEGSTYTCNVARSIKKLIARSYEVRLLPVWGKDIPSNQELLKAVDDPKCTLHICYDSLESYTKELEKCSVFIGQKLHATIMACMRRIPSIMIEYQPKCRDFMASVGMEQYVIKTSECTPAALLSLLDGLETERDAIQKILDKNIIHYQAMQRRQAATIAQKLLAE